MGLLVGTMYEIVPSVQQKKKKGGLVSTRRRNTYFLNSVVRLGSEGSCPCALGGENSNAPRPLTNPPNVSLASNKRENKHTNNI